MSQYQAILNLADINGINGFRIDGAAAGDNMGHSVSPAGDVNGDGIDDIIIGAYHADPNGLQSGAAYVVFGTTADFPTSLSVADLNGTNGFKMSGEAAGDFAGRPVSAGDVNGDGYDDLILGADSASANGARSGASYVVFGKASGFAANIELSTLDGTNGFQLSGAATKDRAGLSVTSAGDVNNDGFDDIIVGAYGADPHGSKSGSTYIVFGKVSGFTGDLNLGALNGTNGFRVDGAAANDYSGRDVSGAGDINGDGYDDVIIGSLGADPHGSYSGAAYVVFGKAGGFAPTLDATALSGTNGFKISGEAAADGAGRSVSGAGDVNGDGYDDVILSAPYSTPHGTDSGAAYVIFGKASGFSANLDLSSLNGTNGFQISGGAANYELGRTVSGAGDVNGDGFDDLIIGEWRAGPHGEESGSTYVVFGKATGFGGNIDITSIDGNNGFRIDGATVGDRAGRSVSGAGDINHDGFADLLVGADSVDTGGVDAGAAYVIYGSKPDEAVTRVGSDIAQTIQGSDFGDTLSGLGGADTLIGNAGSDVLDGGLGRDTMAGGLGDDTYIVDNMGDKVVEKKGGGIDTVFASVSFTLSKNVEALTLTGTDALSGTGNKQANTLTGNTGANTLLGDDGDDLIKGEDGNDVLKGGAGLDSLTGGTGADVLSGGKDADRFVFNSTVASLPGQDNRDEIKDFHHNELDVIALDKIDANTNVDGNQAFVLGGNAFTHTAGELIQFISHGKTIVSGDVNGDGTADFQIELDGAPVLVAGDFVL